MCDREARVIQRPTLQSWLGEYAAIEEEFRQALEASGVVFEPYGEGADHVACLRNQLHERGAQFLNDGSSVSVGFLSSACAACVGDCGSRTFYINLRCNRNCYYCFNPNQADFEEHRLRDTPWRKELEEFTRTGMATHIGLTGGEPLLCTDETCEFFALARELCPDAHLRLYTSGVNLDESFCSSAAANGLNEIRFSIKLDEGEEAIRAALDGIETACRFIPDVMVEMPVVPGTIKRMKQLLVQLEDRGVRGINLLEFCYPLRNWREFSRRGFAIKNPPFAVLYDYGYAGGLPVAGSEEACLELVLFALDEGLDIGVHYCSLDNKNRDQILQANRAVSLDSALYELGEDCFYQVAKVFDNDVDVVFRVFQARGHPCLLEEDGSCLLFHPAFASDAAALGAEVALSWNIVESRGDGSVVRELKLALRDEA